MSGPPTLPRLSLSPLLAAALALSSGPSWAAPASPEQAPAPALALGQVLARIRAEGLSPAAARERAAAAGGAAAQARKWPNPMLELRAENMRPFTAGPLVPWDSADVFATLSQTFEVGGKRSARASGARAALATAEAEARFAEKEALLEGARAYLALVRSREAAATLAENRETLEEVARRTRLKVAEGWTAESDLRRFEAEAARAADMEARARAEISRAEAVLSSLTGEPAAGLAARTSVPALPPVPAGEPEALARAAVERSPEVAAARARLARSREALRFEKARRIPDPDLTLGYKRTGGQDTAVAGVVLPLPLLDGNAGNVVRAGAEERAAEIEARQAERRVRAETAALVSSARALSASAATAAERVVKPAGEVRRAALAAFAEGAADVLKLLDAERVWLEARREALDLGLEAVLRSLEARLALGEEEVP